MGEKGPIPMGRELCTGSARSGYSTKETYAEHQSRATLILVVGSAVKTVRPVVALTPLESLVPWLAQMLLVTRSSAYDARFVIPLRRLYMIIKPRADAYD